MIILVRQGGLVAAVVAAGQTLLLGIERGVEEELGVLGLEVAEE